MTQYIDKSALVAEIERQRKIYMYDVDNKHSFGRMMECNDLLVFLATLEVKEVDLEKELKNLIGNVGQCDRKLARHFFELGLKAHEEPKLTVDDIMRIDALLISMWHNKLENNSYEEVLKQFKAQKGE